MKLVQILPFLEVHQNLEEWSLRSSQLQLILPRFLSLTKAFPQVNLLLFVMTIFSLCLVIKFTHKYCSFRLILVLQLLLDVHRYLKGFSLLSEK